MCDGRESEVPGGEDRAVPHAAKPSRGPDSVSHISHQLPGCHIRCGFSNRSEKLSVPAKHSTKQRAEPARLQASCFPLHPARQPGAPQPGLSCSQPSLSKICTRSGNGAPSPSHFGWPRDVAFLLQSTPRMANTPRSWGPRAAGSTFSNGKEERSKVSHLSMYWGLCQERGSSPVLVCLQHTTSQTRGRCTLLQWWKLRLRQTVILPRPQTPFI